jgi:hypothetical protein
MGACTESCRTPVLCTTCDLYKAPRGRSVAAEMANGMCTVDCPGYMKAPTAGHLWPSESITPEEDETPMPERDS